MPFYTYRFKICLKIKYDESIEMKKELKMAADRLRQKLQSIEEQMRDNDNKHMIDKFNWETQRLQLVSTINRVC